MANDNLAKTASTAAPKAGAGYDHASHEPMRRVLRWMIDNIGWTAFARIDRARIGGWDVIPVHREELDRRALERALQVLAAGEVILIAPEATRHPALGQAREGVAYLGYKSGAPIIPVAIENSRGYPTLMGPWNRRKPGAYFRLGKPVRFKPVSGRLPRERLRLMTDEVLYQLAAMLPERRRGYYSDLSRATTETIEPA